MPLKQGVDQAAAEAVAAAYAVNDVQLVLLAEAVLLGCTSYSIAAQSLSEAEMALTQGDGNLLEAETVSQLLGNVLVALVVQLAAVDVGSLAALMPKTSLASSSLAMQTSTYLHSSPMTSPASALVHSLLAVVQVAADL